MATTRIPTLDLQALIDVAEGYTAENGLDAVGKYAAPEEVHRAIISAKSALRKVGVAID